MPTTDTDEVSRAAIGDVSPASVAPPTAALHQVSIDPQWTLSDAGGRRLPPRLVGLLQAVQQQRSLLAACRSTETSYRHAWQLVREGEAVLGAPLLTMTRYRGSSLTPVAERLLWAESRVRSRLAATLRSLEAELELDIGSVPLPAVAGLRIHASPGPAVSELREALAAAGVEIWWRDSPPLEALALLDAGRCDVVSLFVPTLDATASGIAPLKGRRELAQFSLLPIAARSIGLWVAPGNPRGLSGIADLSRAGIRFAGRDDGSDLRMLADWLLQRAGIEPARIAGYHAPELTLAAMLEAIASGKLDAGFGVESLALRGGLSFIPIHVDHCVLLYRSATARRAAMRELARTVRGDAFRAAVGRIDDHAAAIDPAPLRLRAPSAAAQREAAAAFARDATLQPAASRARPEAAIDALLSRRSVSPKRLRAPAPSPEDIDLMLQAALRAPDHGALCPWRVIEIREAQRPALADRFEQEKLRRDPLASANDLRRAREHAIRPPALLAFVVSPSERSKVPQREQSLAAGAALGNLLNAAHQLGFGAIVLSGERCFDGSLLAGLGIGRNEFLAGFISLGSVAEAAPPARQVLSTRVWSCWSPGS